MLAFGAIGAFAWFGAAAGAQENPPNNPFPLPATTVQLPTFGISIDADGVLSLKSFSDAAGRLRAERLAAAKAAPPGSVAAASKLRKVSLNRLERAIRQEIKAGRPPDEAMHVLAGLTRLQYVFFYPGKEGRGGDIVIAGPAEGWGKDASGRLVSLSSGRPSILLEDLVAALRAFPPGTRNRPFLGCTIDPPADGLVRLKEFQQTIPRAIRPEQRAATAVKIGRGIEEALGMADIRVFGVSDRTHFSQVLVEADYRMKRIGIGAEPPPVKMMTFIAAVDSPQQSTLQRWWFTPDYACVRVSDDDNAMELIGHGVQLQGEDKLLGPDGKLAAGGVKASKPSELFTTSFTAKYPQISAASPVYAQLRNMIDLAIAAAYIRKADLYGRLGWDAAVLRDEKLLPIETHPNPKRVACVVNSFWKGGRLLAPAGGGVSIVADDALTNENLLRDENGMLRAQYEQLAPAIPADRWWWD